MAIQVTSLIENERLDETLLCEHGISMLVETPDLRILFDTGATSAFLDNAETLNIDLSKIDYVVLSHAHNDHTGGLRCLCQSTRRKFELVLNPCFFSKKFVKNGDFLKYIGNDFSEEYLQIENIKTTFPLTDTFQLAPNVFIFSNFEKLSDFEAQEPQYMMLSGGEYKADTFPEEQVLGIRTPKGLILLTGCSHSGIVNICETIRRRMKEPIFSVIGGLHLKGADLDRIKQTAAYFQENNICKLYACHSTGHDAMTYLSLEGSEHLRIPSGEVVRFEFE